MERDTKGLRVLLTVLLLAIAALFIAPVVIVVMNSFKGNLHISSAPFAWPTAESSVCLLYTSGPGKRRRASAVYFVPPAARAMARSIIAPIRRGNR